MFFFISYRNVIKGKVRVSPLTLHSIWKLFYTSSSLLYCHFLQGSIEFLNSLISYHYLGWCEYISFQPTGDKPQQARGRGGVSVLYPPHTNEVP
nr:MAG TPA: hypothetical protein [Crassvirales sp.]